MELKPTVLIVDDIPENIRVLAGFLQKHGINTAIANSGAQALKTLSRVSVDLILLDVVMPEMDGFQLCDKLKSADHTKDIPVIFITARTETEDIVHGFVKGAVDYITKPIQEKEVMARVSTHLELMKHRNHLEDLVNERTASLEKAVRELEKAKKIAETANETKSRFLMNVNHELITPMNGILGMAQLLATTTLDDEQQEYVEIIQTSAHAQMTVINDILHFAESEYELIRLQTGKLNIREIVQTAVNVLSVEAKQKNITFNWRVDGAIPEELLGDARRLRQILLNITGNAVKFTHQGHVSLSVDKDLDNEHSLGLKFAVADTGIGIPKDKLDRLFKPFSQVDDSTTRPYGGLGLGLFNAKEFIDMMGGTIHVDSTPGEGSVFEFTIRVGRGGTS